MRTSTITSLENSLQKTNTWIHEIGSTLDWDNQRAYHALRAVLHALRDRLPLVEANDLASQLPLVVRGVFYENWQPTRTPVRERTKEQFLKHVLDAFPNDLSVDPEATVQAVFKVLARHVSEGEIEDVKQSLPGPIRELWTQELSA